ncbi:MAG: prepilin-type N-terminal cleavage/methylation domain-containing protein [Planctomycetes bacterium]|nr:prepilin-type N-terminal cleavage/methylation domain-containing protein [Planctomycetota bacterium]NBY02695.1 prepilin-type N-terminal cleavage/methylation domain-containing protein [Planctomycetota bacterium]
MLHGARKKTAMTLVELLVVMAIIVIFTAITAAFYPANQADRELSRFSNTVQSALLSARNRAKAERLPTGIRFYDSDANGKIDGVVLIQKPAPLDGLVVGNVTVNPMTFVLGFPATYQGVINPGDFMVLESGDVATISAPLPNATVSNPSSGFYQNLSAYGTKYRIFRGAVELSGDTPFELSNTIEIFVGSGALSIVPVSLLVPGASDIIFNPDGSLNNSTSEVYLHLHNFESLAGNYSRDAILAVRKMSGSIGVYEVGPTGAPYQFAFDPRNKGI